MPHSFRMSTAKTTASGTFVRTFFREASAVIVEFVGLHAHDCDFLGASSLDLGDREKIVHARLMGRNLGGRPNADVVVAQYPQRAGFLMEVAAVEDEQSVGFFNVVEKIGAESAAVADRNAFRRGVGRVKSLHGPNTESFVRPEDVSDPEDKRRAGCGSRCPFLCAVLHIARNAVLSVSLHAVRHSFLHPDPP